jgi:DNA repair exonuclease SbcCD ATPase subunit
MDIDEADMYISAEIQKIEMQLEANKKKELGRACPNCGTSIPQLASKCPACGEPITAEATKELKAVLNHLENALVLLKSGENVEESKAKVERYLREAKLYHDNNAKINMLVDEVKQEMLIAEKRAKKEWWKKNIWTNPTFWMGLYLVAFFVFGGIFVAFF